MLTATIASGTSLSDVVRVPGGKAVVMIIFPDAWTTANITFQVSTNGSDFFNLYDVLGNEITVVAAASRAVRLALTDYWGAPFIKVRSGTAGSAVNQSADRAITLYWQ